MRSMALPEESHSNFVSRRSQTAGASALTLSSGSYMILICTAARRWSAHNRCVTRRSGSKCIGHRTPRRCIGIEEFAWKDTQSAGTAPQASSVLTNVEHRGIKEIGSGDVVAPSAYFFTSQSYAEQHDRHAYVHTRAMG